MRVRWTTTRAWMFLSAATRYIALLGLVAMLGGSAYAAVALEERKLPMKFSWVGCQPNCRGWVSAVGIVIAETPRHFDDFARDHQLKGETVCGGFRRARVAGSPFEGTASRNLKGHRNS